MSSIRLDGPRMKPAGGGQPERLVILVHGYGADGQDLIGLAPHWARLLPDAAFAAPNGPEPCAGAPFGYQWFAIDRLAPAEMWAGVRHAASALDAFIDSELERHGLTGDRLALVGFSQGTMMSLHVGLRRRTVPAAIVGYSGMLPGAEFLKQELAGTPPVLLVHGDADEMIPVQRMHEAAVALGEAGVPVRWHISRGQGHGIAPDGLQLGGHFLRDAFTGRLGTPA